MNARVLLQKKTLSCMCNSETKYLQAISLGNDQFPEHLLFVVLSRQQKMQRQRHCMDYCTTNGVMMLHLFSIGHQLLQKHRFAHTQGVCVFRCNLQPALLPERLGPYTSRMGSKGWNVYRNNSTESAQRKPLTLICYL